MPEILLDCKGLACPKPVLQCKDCIEDEAPEAFEVLVDNQAAKENVERFLSTKGYSAHVLQENGLWLIRATREEAPAADTSACPAWPAVSGESKVCVFITSSRMGTGNDELGGKLMLNFLDTLPELGEELWRLVLVNSGVQLAVRDHEAAEKLKKIADMGVTILVCGTCLDFFGLLDQKAVGETTNMMDVVTSLQLASKVIQV
jgi:selenium metabolism protein YedF